MFCRSNFPKNEPKYDQQNALYMEDQVSLFYQRISKILYFCQITSRQGGVHVQNSGMYQYFVANFDFKHPPTPIVQNTIQQTPKYTPTPRCIIQYTIKQTAKYTLTPPYIVQYTIQKTAKYTPTPPQKNKNFKPKNLKFLGKIFIIPTKKFSKNFLEN